MQQVLQLPDFQEEAGSFLSSFLAAHFSLEKEAGDLIICASCGPLIVLSAFHPLHAFKLIFPYFVSPHRIHCI